jgi:hypothetical protein
VTISTVDVERSPDDVFAYVTDQTRFAEWQSGVVTGHMETSGAPAVGDRCFITRRIGFAQRVSTSEVTHVDPPRTWGVRGIDGPIRATVDVTVEGLDDGRRSRLSIESNSKGTASANLSSPSWFVPKRPRKCR